MSCLPAAPRWPQSGVGHRFLFVSRIFFQRDSPPAADGGFPVCCSPRADPNTLPQPGPGLLGCRRGFDSDPSVPLSPGLVPLQGTTALQLCGHPGRNLQADKVFGAGGNETALTRLGFHSPAPTETDITAQPHAPSLAPAEPSTHKQQHVDMYIYMYFFSLSPPGALKVLKVKYYCLLCCCLTTTDKLRTSCQNVSAQQINIQNESQRYVVYN